MTDTPGSGGHHQCPECGTPKGPDGSPACDCNQRTADALRDARTAEQAAAEDWRLDHRTGHDERLRRLPPDHHAERHRHLAGRP
ncbi:peptidoglycan-binding protein, partial [Streptomyces sp900105755]